MIAFAHRVRYTFREYIAHEAASNQRLIETWTRGDGDSWAQSRAGEPDFVVLDPIGARLAVRELYDAAGV